MNMKWWPVVLIAITAGFLPPGIPLAQTTTTTDVRNFAVISVDGNRLVVRDQNGTHEYTVPDDFRFTVNGKQVSVKELAPGMKGTATITTKTTIKPVVVTEIREGVVLSAGPGTMIVRDAEGVRKRYSQDQLDERGIQIVKEGRLIRIGEVKQGDVLTATIVSKGPPVVVSEQEVQATLTGSKGEPASTKVASVAAPAQLPASAAAPAASPASSAAEPPRPMAEQSGSGLTWFVVLAVLAAVIAYFFARRRKQQ